MHGTTFRFGLAGFFAVAAIASGGELSPATLAAWNDYIAAAQTTANERINAGKGFLWIEDTPDRAARVRRNEIVVSPATEHTPKRVPSGMIHDWIAGSFIPDSTLDRVIASLREYDRYHEIYKPAVIESKALDAAGDEDRFSLRLLNHAVLSKIAVDAEFTATFVRNGDRACRIASVKHIREIEDYGQKNQREMPEDQGSGYVWRFYSISRLEERDGGVYFETEMIALSRDIPASLQWLVSPMIRRIAKGSLTAMLSETRQAVLDSVSVEARQERPATQSAPATALRARSGSNR